jgi:GNAT superfamily N-acetyltransferase
MVVAESERRRGGGRALVETAIERCSAKGCGLIEVTSNIDLSPAHTFYRQLGFERTSYRFARRFDCGEGVRLRSG